MSKEVLLYGQIDRDSSVEFIEDLQEVGDDDVLVRLNCIGGEPEYGWGMAAKFNECKGSKEVLVDGQAHSMGMFFVCYADKVSAYNVAEFLVHRCAYPTWIESSETYFTDAMRGNLERINTSLMKAMAAKIDVDAFNNLKQVQEAKIKFKDIFSMDGRLEVFLTAADAKKIGLIDSILPLTPQKAASINSLIDKLGSKLKKAAVAEEKQNIQTEKKDKTMTIEKLKTEHPELYAQVVKRGVTKERDRVTACLVYNEIDPAGVKAAILSGEKLSETAKAEFSLKSFNKEALAKIEATNTEVIKTGAADGLTEKQIQENAFCKKAGLPEPHKLVVKEEVKK